MPLVHGLSIRNRQQLMMEYPCDVMLVYLRASTINKKVVKIFRVI